MVKRAAWLMATTMLLAGACDDGEKDPEGRTVQAYKAMPDPCSVVSAGTLKRLWLAKKQPGRVSYRGGKENHCYWQYSSPARELRVISAQVHDDEAQARKDFQSGADVRQRLAGNAIPVKGLGDEAELRRSYAPQSWQRTKLRLRKGNALLEIGADIPPDEMSSRSKTDVELEMFGMARAWLARLDPSATPAPREMSRPPGGEVSWVRGICGSVKQGRLSSVVKGPGGYSGNDTGSLSNCYWFVDEGDIDGNTVEVVAVPASVLTGETGTQIATSLMPAWTGRPSQRIKGIGDDAYITRGRNDVKPVVAIHARRGNLLFYGEYSAANKRTSVQRLERAAIRVTNAVIADQD